MSTNYSRSYFDFKLLLSTPPPPPIPGTQTQKPKLWWPRSSSSIELGYRLTFPLPVVAQDSGRGPEIWKDWFALACVNLGFLICKIGIDRINRDSHWLRKWSVTAYLEPGVCLSSISAQFDKYILRFYWGAVGFGPHLSPGSSHWFLSLCLFYLPIITQTCIINIKCTIIKNHTRCQVADKGLSVGVSGT